MPDKITFGHEILPEHIVCNTFSKKKMPTRESRVNEVLKAKSTSEMLNSADHDGEDGAVLASDLGAIAVCETNKRTYTFRSDSVVALMLRSLQEHDNIAAVEAPMANEGTPVSGAYLGIETADETIRTETPVQEFNFGTGIRQSSCGSASSGLQTAQSSKRQRVSFPQQFAQECSSDEESLCCTADQTADPQTDLRCSPLSHSTQRSTTPGYMHPLLPSEQQKLPHEEIGVLTVKNYSNSTTAVAERLSKPPT